MGAIVAYWERVASSSNLADAPSRGAQPALLPGWPAPAHVNFAQALQQLDLRIGAGQVVWGGRDLHIHNREPARRPTEKYQ